MQIIVYKPHEQNKEFYSIMGYYFAHKKYAYEMGGWKFYSKEGITTWFLAYVDNILVGFCALFEETTHLFMDNFYIIKEYRGKGYSRTLFDYRLNYAKINFKKEIRAITDNVLQEKNYIRNNMEYYGLRGHYKKYRILIP